MLFISIIIFKFKNNNELINIIIYFTFSSFTSYYTHLYTNKSENKTLLDIN